MKEKWHAKDRVWSFELHSARSLWDALLLQLWVARAILVVLSRESCLLWDEAPEEISARWETLEWKDEDTRSQRVFLRSPTDPWLSSIRGDYQEEDTSVMKGSRHFQVFPLNLFNEEKIICEKYCWVKPWREKHSAWCLQCARLQGSVPFFYLREPRLGECANASLLTFCSPFSQWQG